MKRKHQIMSDPHWFHENILSYPNMAKFRSDRYSSVEQMNKAIIDDFNEHADEKTVSFILGDVCFGYGKKGIARVEEIVSQLVGEIILVSGNHDHKGTKDVFRAAGHQVHDYYEFRDYEHLICMSHYPFRVWNKSHHGSVMMHGHCHGTLQGATGRIIDVGWDVHGRTLDLLEAFNMAVSKTICRENDHH